MSEILKDVSYIIGYRQASADRKLGLQFVLNWLYKYLPDMEILLIEQDDTSKIDVILPPNCKKHFTYNPGLYNRCWAFNVGVNLTDKKILAFADSDMFMDKADYISAFEACRDFQVINPNGQTTYNVINADADALTYEISEKRKLWTFAAGLIMMQREAFDQIGGWDERFEGWGGEDDAISHIIYNTLVNKTFDFKMYHVDHARSVFDGKTQPGYLYNRMLFEEIITLSGISLERYLARQRAVKRGDPYKYKTENRNDEIENLRLVLAVTTYNRKKYIEEFLESWDKTRDRHASWTVIIADDGSPDGTPDYLDNLSYDGVRKIVLKNSRLGIAGQTNTIISQLMALDFDVCFCCNDDILFTREGWEKLYIDVIKRTGYDHLCYYDTRWKLKNNLEEPLVRGQLCNSCAPENVQGCFFTLTPELIRRIGYFDTAHFGFRGLAHVDFTWRCCRGGYNVLDTPFDVLNSNDYIETQKENYLYSIPGPLQSLINNESEKRRKWKIIRMNRVFVPKNEINVMPEILEKHERGEEVELLWKKQQAKEEARNMKDPPETPSGKQEPAGEILPEEKTILKKETLNKTSVREEPANRHYVHIAPQRMLSIPVDKVENVMFKTTYKYANEKKAPGKGLSRVVNRIGRKTYNFCLHHGFHFIVKSMDTIANKLIRTGYKIKNIDN